MNLALPMMFSKDMANVEHISRDNWFHSISIKSEMLLLGTKDQVTNTIQNTTLKHKRFWLIWSL